MTENRKLDMSLDEIIRLDGIKGARRGGGPPLRRDNFSRNGGGGSNGRFQPKRLNAGGARSAYSYNGDRSYGGGPQQNRYSSNGGGGGYRGRQNAMNGFDGGNRLGGGRQQGCTLHVSNLAPTVNAEDVEELFSTFGDLVRSTVHYDQHGISLGTADIIFERRDKALEARTKLNNVPLDGKPLRIILLSDSDDDPFQTYLRMGNSRNPRNGGDHQQQHRNNYQNNRSSNRSGGGGNRMGGGRRDNGGRGGGGGPAPSAEDLDKEMDDWRMQVDADKD